MTKRISLTQYLIEQQRGEAQIPAQLRLLIEVVARACKRIAISVNKGALGEVLGTAPARDPAILYELRRGRAAIHPLLP